MKLHIKQAKHITQPQPPSGGGGKTKGEETGSSLFSSDFLISSKVITLVQ